MSKDKTLHNQKNPRFISPRKQTPQKNAIKRDDI